MKKLFSLIVILAFVAVSCCKHHQPSKSSNTKQNPAEQQDTLPKPDPEPFPEPESNTVEYPLTIKTLEDSTVVSFYYEHWYEGINQYTDWT